MIKRSKRLTITAGLLGISMFIISIFFTANYSHSFQNWYTANEYFDWHTMAISHFGVSNLAVPFTIITSLVSLLIIYFILGIRKEYGNEGLLKKGTSWIIVGYSALMLAFLFLLYQPHSSLSIAIHFLVAILYFVSIPVGIVLIGKHFVNNNKRLLGYASLLLGIGAFILGPIICIGSSLLLNNKGVAIPEFIQIIIEDTWILLMCINLIRNGVKYG